MVNDVSANPAPAGFPLFRHDRLSMVRDDVRGEWVRLNDARWALQGMQSELESLRTGANLGSGPESRLGRERHRHNGDLLRIWAIIGDPNQQGMRQDMFQRLQAIMDELRLLREYYQRRHEAEGSARDADALPAPPPPRLTSG